MPRTGNQKKDSLSNAHNKKIRELFNLKYTTQYDTDFLLRSTTFAFYDYHDSTIKSNIVFCSNRSHTVADIASISFLEIFHLIPLYNSSRNLICILITPVVEFSWQGQSYVS